LKKIAETGFIEILDSKQIKKYGIEESDGRVKYIVMKENKEITNHVDSIFKLFDEGNSEDKLAALFEIDSYKKVYVLNPLQLDVLAKNLNKDDIELTYQILVILSNHIINKNIHPSNIPVLLDKLRPLLAESFSLLQKRPALRGHVIALLGMYNDKAVIDQLIEDARTMEDLSDVKDEYDKRYTARVIENHRTELFNLERELRTDGKDKNTKVLSQIRNQAKKNLGIADRDGSISIPGIDLTGVDLK